MVGDRPGRSGGTIVAIPSLASPKLHIPAEKLGPLVHCRGPYAETQRKRGPSGSYVVDTAIEVQ